MEKIICPKCGRDSGNNWKQCGSACPMPMSPHYKEGWQRSMLDRIESVIKDNIEAALPRGMVVDYRYAAVSVLLCLETPTLRMVESGADYLHKVAPFTLQEVEARDCFVAMIKAARE